MNDGERVPLILTSTSIYKWFEKVSGQDFKMHVDYIQIPGSKIRDLLIALKMKKWVMDKNPDNTCAFVGVNMPPHDKNGLPQTALMRKRCYTLNGKYMELNGPLMAPQWGASGARHGTNESRL